MTAETESLRQKFERHIVATGQFEGELIFEAGHYLCPDVQEIWERYQAVHTAAKAETAAAVATERERAAQFCDRRQAELLALVPGARRSNVVRTHEACANTAAVLAQAIRAGVKEPDGDPTL